MVKLVLENVLESDEYDWSLPGELCGRGQSTPNPCEDARYECREKEDQYQK